MSKVIQRRGEASCRELVARQVDSGLSVQEFCRREGFNVGTFYGWRSRLRARPTQAAESSTKSVVPEAPAKGFIDLGALNGAGASRCEIRLDLGAGVVLQVVRG